MKKIQLFGATLFLVFASGLFIYSINGNQKEKMLKEGTTQYFPTEVDFAGEKAPLQIADVKERFDRELLVNANLHSSTILVIKRANRAFPIIEPILKQYGVPDDFKYLAVIESALVNAVSSAGARGVWQFMPETAKEKGMEVSETVDERYHLQKSTEAACKYLLKAKEINPGNVDHYYNLARVTSMLGIHSEALEYVNIYLLYNKYNVIANEIYCDCTYSLQQYRNAHNGAKWLLSICRNNEFDPKYFFYFTTSLSYYMDRIEGKHHNLDYVSDMLELYDQYPKPDSFWINDNGSRSMYWAANLCYKIGNYEKGVSYLQCILENVKEYSWPLLEKCKFQLLPECLHGLQQYERLIQLLEMPTLEVLQKHPDDPSVRLSCFYISYAYSVQGNDEKKMQWALSCIKCYQQMSDPPIDWLANNLLVNFQSCLENNMKTYLISFGNIYLDFIKTPQAGHVWLTHHFANFYSEEGNQDEALNSFLENRY